MHLIDLPTVQFITPAPTHTPFFYQLINDVCQSGIRWVQFRNKTITDEKLKLAIAMQVKAICKKYTATFIINDDVALCKLIQPDGIHLGRQDSSIASIKNMFPTHFIYGASSNTITEVVEAKANGAYYSGIGPLQFTTTKQNLNPLLGIPKLKEIVSQASNAIPLVAIGGITINDIAVLKQIGIKHIAVSSVISQSNNYTDTTKKLLAAMEK